VHERDCQSYDAFELIADGVAVGLVAPWRLYLARGCRYVSISVGDRAEWDAWRIHLGCPDLTIRVYEAEEVIRRSSVAEIVGAAAGYPSS